MQAALRTCPASIARSVSCRYAFASPITASLRNSCLKKWRSPILAPAIRAAHLHQTCRLQQTAAQATIEPTGSEKPHTADDPHSETASPKDDTPLSKFSQLVANNLVHKNIIDAVTRMGIETMTEVQAKTISQALSGDDMIARAKTGTGKTLAFLLPVLQNILTTDPHLAEPSRMSSRMSSRMPSHTSSRMGERASSRDIRAIVVAPTRELAEQIAEEARKVTSRTSLVVQVAVGGTQKQAMLRELQHRGCHLLVATPGRLFDILSDPYSNVQAPKLTTLVYDEADRLLDSGFQRELRSILEYLPDPKTQPRQTLMFSATVPDEVKQLVRQTLKRGFHFINTVSKDEVPTHERVPQKIVATRGMENLIPTLYELFEREIEKSAGKDGRPFKAIVFFNSKAEVQLAWEVFSSIRRDFRQNHAFKHTNIYQTHSGRSQGQRTKSTDDFRRASSAILLSTDVTARGLDFPNVTHVIQLSLPHDRETYIHRIGRTGRAGKEGEAWLLIPKLEYQEAGKRLNTLPVEEDDSLESAKVDMTQQATLPNNIAENLNRLGKAYQLVDPMDLNTVYSSHLSSMNHSVRNKQSIIDAINNLATYGWGMTQLPALSRQYVERMNLGLCRGINVRGAMTQRGATSSQDSNEADPFDAFDDEEPKKFSRGAGRFQNGHGRQRDGGFDNDRRRSPKMNGFNFGRGKVGKNQRYRKGSYAAERDAMANKPRNKYSASELFKRASRD